MPTEQGLCLTSQTKLTDEVTALHPFSPRSSLLPRIACSSDFSYPVATDGFEKVGSQKLRNY